MEVQVIDDKDVLKQHKDELFALVQGAYAKSGGFASGMTPRSMVKNTDRAKLVFSRDGKILACALYRADLGGYKRFGSAGIPGNAESLEAVNEIIKSDIEPYDNWYWVEASGAIEHLFQKNGGHPIPNSLVWHYLKLEHSDPRVKLDGSDGFHYFRTIGGEVRRKMLFGFKDEETKKMAESLVRKYGEDNMSIEAMDKRVDESNHDASVEAEEAATFLSRIFDFHCDFNVNEMLPEWRDRILDSISIIKDNLDSVDNRDRRMYEGAIARGEECLETMDVLKFIKVG